MITTTNSFTNNNLNINTVLLMPFCCYQQQQAKPQHHSRSWALRPCGTAPPAAAPPRPPTPAVPPPLRRICVDRSGSRRRCVRGRQSCPFWSWLYPLDRPGSDIFCILWDMANPQADLFPAMQASCCFCIIKLRILVKTQKDNGHGWAPLGVLAELNLGKYFLAV